MIENIIRKFYFAFLTPVDDRFEFVTQDESGRISFAYVSWRKFKFDFFHDNILSAIRSENRFSRLHLIESYYDGVKKEFSGEFAQLMFVECLKHGYLNEDDGYSRDKVFRVVIDGSE